MLPLTMNCPSCDRLMELTPSFRNQCRRVWRCGRPCRKSINFLHNNFFGDMKICLNVRIRALLLIIMDLDEAQILAMTGMAKTSSIKLKDLFMIKVRDEYCNDIQRVGGPGHIIQIDETVVCRGRIIQSPTTFHDPALGPS